MLAEYNNTVKEYIDEGIVEVVGPDYVMVKKALLIICHIEHLSQKPTVQRKFEKYLTAQHIMKMNPP